MPGFGDYSIEQLMAMVAHFSPETVEARGTALVKAAGDIKAIGEILKSHKVSGWEGEASTAFQEWVSQAGSATLRLSEYSATGGKYMVEAGQTMREVRRDMPKRGEVEPELANYAAARKFHNDPDMQPISRDSWRKLEAHRAGAVQQLEKLASSYTQSAYQMNKAEIPTFPPPPANFVPQGDNGSTIIERPGGGSGTVGNSGGPSHGPQVASGASSSELDVPTGRSPGSNDSFVAPSTTGPTTAPVSAIPDLDLNHVGTLPDKSLPQAPVGAGAVGPGGTAVTPGGATPLVPVSPIAVVKPGGGLGPVGGGMFPGAGGLTGKAGAVAGLPPRDTGIVGGRPISGVGPSAGIPRGTVIGAEGGQTAGRGVMGGGMGGGTGGAHGASGGSAVGRRFATEPGGVVGGRPPVSGGRSITGGQSFTQGGSGLVRGVAGAGPVGGMGHGAAGVQGPGKRRDGQGGERPDYLAEDEETWQANRRVVPPVID
ncbi:WXG100 family type VII secretion target [Streptomyces sp. NPDC002602]|uniref:WXG100 family type VII secretion target n=1 Tax=Streptomyces sp. NPDC002602 TaxID=3364654 RepID=UPI003689C536